MDQQAGNVNENMLSILVLVVVNWNTDVVTFTCLQIKFPTWSASYGLTYSSTVIRQGENQGTTIMMTIFFSFFFQVIPAQWRTAGIPLVYDWAGGSSTLNRTFVAFLPLQLTPISHCLAERGAIPLRPSPLFCSLAGFHMVKAANDFTNLLLSTALI